MIASLKKEMDKFRFFLVPVPGRSVTQYASEKCWRAVKSVVLTYLQEANVKQS